MKEIFDEYGTIGAPSMSEITTMIYNATHE
jgi:hypothetical protein